MVEKSIEFDIAMASNLPRIYADSSAVKQILNNLLSNAVKFTPPGGKVNLRVGHQGNGEVVLTVADTGCGIPRDQLPLVIRPFHQVDASLSRTEVGAGLGLPLSASLVALHGGQMHIASEVGQGTTVHITFPMERIAVADAA